MRVIHCFAVSVVAGLVLVSSCLATGEVPTPKQAVTFDYSGQYKDLIGQWTGDLSYHRIGYSRSMGYYNDTNWKFRIYVTSIGEKNATGVYCWSAVDKFEPGCRKVEGTFDPVEEKVVFNWSERTLTLMRSILVGDYHRVYFQKSGERPCEGMAQKVVTEKSESSDTKP